MYLRQHLQVFNLRDMALGSRVRFYREYRKWTLEELAERSSVEVGTISALEVRNSKRSNFALALAQAFGLTVEQLIDESRNWLAKGVGHDLGTQQTADLHVNERDRGSYITWPFPDVTVTEWKSMTSEEHAEVQGFVRALLARRRKRRAA